MCTRIGGPREEFTSLPFDFFTSSTNVSKKIMEAVSNNLAPATLESGGISFVFIDYYVDLDQSPLIYMGQISNLKPTCTASDYVLVDKKVSSNFTDKLKESINA